MDVRLQVGGCIKMRPRAWVKRVFLCVERNLFADAGARRSEPERKMPLRRLLLVLVVVLVLEVPQKIEDEDENEDENETF